VKGLLLLPLAITAGILFGAGWLWTQMDSSAASAAGAFWSAVAATVAFVWLIAGYFLQSRELSLQRDQLTLQRTELANQRLEMRRMAEQATLGQVATMLASFESSLPARTMTGGRSLLTTVHELPTVLATALEGARVTLTATEHVGQFHAYNRWAPIEGLALQFLGIVAGATRLYASNTDRRIEESGQDDADFVVANLPVIGEIPHLQLYALAAETTARILTVARPFILRVRFQGLRATNEVIPGSIAVDQLEALGRQVEGLAAHEGLMVPRVRT